MEHLVSTWGETLNPPSDQVSVDLGFTIKKMNPRFETLYRGCLPMALTGYRIPKLKTIVSVFEMSRIMEYNVLTLLYSPPCYRGLGAGTDIIKTLIKNHFFFILSPQPMEIHYNHKPNGLPVSVVNHDHIGNGDLCRCVKSKDDDKRDELIKWYKSLGLKEVVVPAMPDELFLGNPLG